MLTKYEINILNAFSKIIIPLMYNKLLQIDKNEKLNAVVFAYSLSDSFQKFYKNSDVSILGRVVYEFFNHNFDVYNSLNNLIADKIDFTMCDQHIQRKGTMLEFRVDNDLHLKSMFLQLLLIIHYPFSRKISTMGISVQFNLIKGKLATSCENQEIEDTFRVGDIALRSWKSKFAILYTVHHKFKFTIRKSLGFRTINDLYDYSNIKMYCPFITEIPTNKHSFKYFISPEYFLNPRKASTIKLLLSKENFHAS